jgi:hypothetical protein
MIASNIECFNVVRATSYDNTVRQANNSEGIPKREEISWIMVLMGRLK